MRSTYHRSCKYCGTRIQLRQTPTGQWMAFEGAVEAHKCGRPSNRKQPANQSSKGDIFDDVAFPKEFVLKGETRRSKGFAAPRPGKKRSVKRQSPPSAQASSPETRHGFGLASNGRFFLLSIIILLILLFLRSRFS